MSNYHNRQSICPSTSHILAEIPLTSLIFIQAMNNQEAVNLIGHLEDPREAAECLAKEAN